MAMVSFTIFSDRSSETSVSFICWRPSCMSSVVFMAAGRRGRHACMHPGLRRQNATHADRFVYHHKHNIYYNALDSFSVSLLAPSSSSERCAAAPL